MLFSGASADLELKNCLRMTRRWGEGERRRKNKAVSIKNDVVQHFSKVILLSSTTTRKKIKHDLQLDKDKASKKTNEISSTVYGEKISHGQYLNENQILFKVIERERSFCMRLCVSEERILPHSEEKNFLMKNKEGNELFSEENGHDQGS